MVTDSAHGDPGWRNRELARTTDPTRTAVCGVTNDSLYEAALAWWENKRPVGWTPSEHLANPSVNCVGPAERALAAALARGSDA